MNKKIIILISSFICVLIIIYLIFMGGKEKNSELNNAVETINYVEETTDFSNYTETNVDLETVSEVYEINEGGVQHITGTINGYIKVNSNEDVKIILDNATITNNNGPCIYGVNSKKIYIELVGENTLTDGSAYKDFDEEVKAAIFSNDDLIFSGTGTLTINANYNDAISSDDDIIFENGTYTIKSIDDSIRGKDSVVIHSGIFTINAGGDGIKSTNNVDKDKGYILIKNGTFNITSTNDGMDAATNIEIDAGDFSIKTTGNSDSSSKGIKADNNILIKNGNINIDSADDSIHSNNTVQIDGGEISIKSNDDGIHADGLVVINGGTITIDGMEGIEGTYVKINDGTININASDDGINAADKSSNYTPTVEINGGNVTIKMGAGDTDGIDSNGNLYINGGTINITGQSPFDYDKEAKYTGGTLIVNGEKTTTITNQFGGMPGNNMPNDRRLRNAPAGGNMNERARI